MIDSKKNQVSKVLENYQTDRFYDELFQSSGEYRPFLQPFAEYFNQLSFRQLKKRQKELKKIGESDRYTLKFIKPNP